MALTKVNRGGLNTGISDSSDATFLTATSSEGVTLAGTLAVTGIHTVGNNAIYTSDGSAVTQNTVQSLVKCWVQFDGTASGGASARDSFNVASLTDHSEGRTGINFTNNMSNDDFSAPVGGQDTTTRTNVHTSFENQSTSMVETIHFESGSAADCNRVGVIVAGDLA